MARPAIIVAIILALIFSSGCRFALSASNDTYRPRRGPRRTVVFEDGRCSEFNDECFQSCNDGELLWLGVGFLVFLVLFVPLMIVADHDDDI